MPYIKPSQREYCDQVIDCMISNNIQPNGELNYILFKYCKDYITPSYNNYKNFRRRILAPYEDGKINENGDV